MIYEHFFKTLCNKLYAYKKDDDDHDDRPQKKTTDNCYSH